MTVTPLLCCKKQLETDRRHMELPTSVHSTDLLRTVSFLKDLQGAKKGEEGENSNNKV